MAGDHTASILDPAIKIVYSELFLKKKMQVREAVHSMSQFIRRKRASFIKVMDSLASVDVFETSKTRHTTTRVIHKNIRHFYQFRALRKLNIIKNIISFFSNHRVPQIADESIVETFIPEGT